VNNLMWLVILIYGVTSALPLKFWCVFVAHDTQMYVVDSYGCYNCCLWKWT